jgi:hypothetical protein
MRKTKKRLTKRKPPDQEDDEAACNLTAQFPEDESQQKEDALVIPTEAEGSALKIPAGSSTWEGAAA